MLASQLRDEIGCSPGNSHISSFLVLEALTTLRCCEIFSLERLELLGDAVLKYALSCHLFLKYPKNHEGAALSLMRWLGVNATFDGLLVQEAKMTASLWHYHPKNNTIEVLQSKLGYEFSVKGLLLEAITHPSQQELGIGYCYQRLEFLGDAVLDLLLTRYLYRKHSTIDPGELTDLRSASVSNENFAQVAVKHNLQQHLQHGSGVLLEQIATYVKCISGYKANEDSLLTLHMPKGPKVLGDMVESIAGAILIDTNLNLDKVWEVFEPLLSPIMTPDKLPLPPLRELMELCSWHGIFIDIISAVSSEETAVQLRVQLKDDLLVGHGCDRSKKAAKAQAALSLLKDLKDRGISHAQYVSMRNKCEPISSDESKHSNSEANIFTSPENAQTMEHDQSQNQKMIGCLFPLDSCMENCHLNDEPPDNAKIVKHDRSEDQKKTGCLLDLDSSMKNCHLDCHSRKCISKIDKPVILFKNQKGAPRTALFGLCKRSQWPLPKCETEEQKFRNPIIVNGVPTPYFNNFTSKITLHIPNTTVITLVGEPRTDKKLAHDSASLAMLLELQRQGRCTIQES